MQNTEILWENSLPRDMLYQLCMYAMSQAGNRAATILYPVIGEHAKEAKIEIRDPIYGKAKAQVVLRPLNLIHLNELVSGPQRLRTQEARGDFAHYLAFGKRESSASFIRKRVEFPPFLSSD
jgi:5-methylcytosine-specific restriction enzyme subunit McrC